MDTTFVNLSYHTTITPNEESTDTIVNNFKSCSLDENHITISSNEWIIFAISLVLILCVAIPISIRNIEENNPCIKFMIYSWIVIRSMIFACILSILISSFITLAYYPVSTAKVSENVVTWNLIWDPEEENAYNPVNTFDIVMWTLGILVIFLLYIIMTGLVSFFTTGTKEIDSHGFEKFVEASCYVIGFLIGFGILFGIIFTFTTLWLPIFQFSIESECNCTDGFIMYIITWFLYILACIIGGLIAAAILYLFTACGCLYVHQI